MIMAYKVFFAFQMDIDEKYGKTFIQQSITNAIQKFKEEGIEVILDYGFRGTPGTPLLIDEMLRKSLNSDMVIVDWTFTSSKIWHNPEIIEEDDNSIILEILKGDLKPSPNPNVLLETGYAWAKKGTHRTLAVMNAAFGNPDELPVDIKGFRYPILYNLDGNNYGDRKEVRKELTDDLYKAIRFSIKSEANYLQEKFLPIKLYNNWNPRDFNSYYYSTQHTIDVIEKLRDSLETTDISCRLVGPDNSGKTRLAYELYNEIYKTLPKHVNLGRVLYYDLSCSNYSSIENVLFDVKEQNQRWILIVDNCDEKHHRKIFEECYESKISLLTIGDSVIKGCNNFIFEEQHINEIIEGLSNENGDPRNTAFILETSKANIRIANLLINSSSGDLDRVTLDYETKWKEIIGESMYFDKVMSVLEELALYTHIGFSNEYKSQSDIILQNTNLESFEDLSEIVYYLVQKGILKVVGDNIVLAVFIEELAIKRLEELADDDLIVFFNSLINLKLSKQFTNRLIELCSSTKRDDIDIILSKTKELFSQYEFVNSNEGARILMNIVEINPELILDAIESALEKKTYDDLREFKKGRRYIVWTIEKILYHTHIFDRASMLLFRLTVSENETISNNSTNQFNQLFHIVLPGTNASLSSRFLFLQSLIGNNSLEEINVIVNALNHGLKVGSFNRMGGANRQISGTYEDYMPKKSEVMEYFKSIIETLEVLGRLDILIGRFSSLVYKGYGDIVLKPIERKIIQDKIISKDFHLVLQEVLNDSRSIDKLLLSRIEELFNKYKGKSLRDKFKFNVALAQYSHSKDKNGDRIDRSQVIVEQIAEDLLKDSSCHWIESIDELLIDEQKYSFFLGRKLGELGFENSLFVQKVLEKLERISVDSQNTSFLEGYLFGLKDDEIIRDVVELFLQNENVLIHSVKFTKCIQSIEILDLEKLYLPIEGNPRLILDLRYLNLNGLTDENIISYLNWIKDIDNYGWVIAVDCFYNRIKKDKGFLLEPFKRMAKTLIMKEGILLMESWNLSFGRHKLIKLIQEYISDSNDDEVIQFVTEQIAIACENFFLQSEHDLIELLGLLLDVNYYVAWGELSEYVLRPSYLGWYTLKKILNAIDKIDEVKLIEWMDKNPDDAPQKVIGFARTRIHEGEEIKWTSIVLTMFDKYNKNEEFLDILSSDLHSYTYSGSAVPILEQRLNLVSTLLDHRHKEIRDFANDNIRYFKGSIKRAKRSDENESLYRN